MINSLTKEEKNSRRQFSVFSLAEYLFCEKGYSIQDTVEFISGLVKQDYATWDEEFLVKILKGIRNENKF